jgi:hypothetical protein
LSSPIVLLNLQTVIACNSKGGQGVAAVTTTRRVYGVRVGREALLLANYRRYLARRVSG